jgi:MATE family multidrug resistance protein
LFGRQNALGVMPAQLPVESSLEELAASSSEAAPRVWPSFARECRDTLALSLPLISGQLSQMLMGVADTVMVGSLGVVPLGAATLANTIIVVPFVLGMGLMSAVSVRVSQARGAQRPDEAQEALRHGTWLALAYSVAVAIAIVLFIPHLNLLRQPAEITAAAPPFLLLCTISLTPALLSIAWKNHADALNRPWRPFWIILGGVLLNIFLNYLWIPGRWGFPALGLRGAGYATLTARTVSAAAMFLWLTRSEHLRLWTPLRWFTKCRRCAFGHLLAIGFPASLHMLVEVSAFAASSLMIGALGAVALAAHQVAITCAATTFMVPLGVAMATTVRVGEAAGAREYPRLHRILVGGWIYAVGFMLFSTAAFLIEGKEIASQFVNDGAVIETARRLLIVAGIFQLFDGIQIVASCALRGVNDVRMPAWIAFFAYWMIALPCSAYFGLHLGQGPFGVWTGLAAGLASAAGALGLRAWRKLACAEP